MYQRLENLVTRLLDLAAMNNMCLLSILQYSDRNQMITDLETLEGIIDLIGDTISKE